MKLIKKTLVAAALSGFAVAASAMTPMADDSLSQVAGQDGVSIAASLHVNIGEFRYTNTNTPTAFDASGAPTAMGEASIAFKNIKMDGLFAMSMNVISGAHFGAIRAADQVSGTFFNPASDVVQIAIPPAVANAATGQPTNIALGDTTKLLDFSVDRIEMGGSTASFGKMAFNDIDLRGTRVWIWAN